MSFPLTDIYWVEVCNFLQQHAEPLSPILAPNEFLEFFTGTSSYNITYVLSPEQFEFVVFHKGMLSEVEAPFALTVLQTFKPIFANAVFVVYARHSYSDVLTSDHAHLFSLLQHRSTWEAQLKAAERSPTSAIVITTYNRSESLARSLPQILDLNTPIVIVDDGSDAECHCYNQRIAEKYQVPLLHVPINRGLCNAINNGVGYWLADPAIDWISCFSDDVDVDPSLFSVLEKVQNRRDRPLLTGYHAAEHRTYGIEAIADIPVHYKRATSGHHLHAHRQYWSSVLPVPTPYLGAPKRDRGKPGQGADEDWWITAWSPHAITKRGGYVVCVPNLVKTFQTTAYGSTWGNVSLRDSAGNPVGGAIAAERTAKTDDLAK